MTETEGIVGIVRTSGLMCLECVGNAKLAEQEGRKDIPEINDAITLAPSWQSQVAGGQTLMACVPLPTCYEHISVGAQSAQQRALRSGLFLGGNGVG